MRFHIELRWRVPLFAVAASLAALLVVALAGASAGRTTAESIEGTWNYGSGQILVTPSGAGAFVGVVTRTATFSAGCPHPVGEKIWQLRGSGLHYEGTHQGFGTGGCSDTRTFPATWDVTETSGAYAARECVTITVDNNRLDCQTLERAKPPAPTTPTGGKFKPGKGLDIAIAIDTTGSMGSSIAQAQEDARKLVRDVKKFAPDVAFSVVQFRDKGDVPEYNVEQVMTANAAAVEAALNRLAASGGGDYPEAYGLAFRNLRDPAVGWRASSRKLVVVIGDAEPHGAGTAGFKGCVDTSADPYGVDTKAELAGLNGLGFTLIMIRQASTASTSLECYQSLVKLAYKGRRGAQRRRGCSRRRRGADREGRRQGHEGARRQGTGVVRQGGDEGEAPLPGERRKRQDLGRDQGLQRQQGGLLRQDEARPRRRRQGLQRPLDTAGLACRPDAALLRPFARSVRKPLRLELRPRRGALTVASRGPGLRRGPEATMTPWRAT